MNKVLLFSDGACRGNQEELNIGGYGALLIFGEHEKEIYGGQLNTTNNVMELKGMIEGLKALTRKNIHVEIYSDSAYIVNAFREGWIKNWQRNGWKTSAKKPVENRDLWEELIELVHGFDDVSFYKIKGHLSPTSTSVKSWYQKFISQKDMDLETFKKYLAYNNRVDALANKGCDEVFS